MLHLILAGAADGKIRTLELELSCQLKTRMQWEEIAFLDLKYFTYIELRGTLLILAFIS